MPLRHLVRLLLAALLAAAMGSCIPGGQPVDCTNGCSVSGDTALVSVGTSGGQITMQPAPGGATLALSVPAGAVASTTVITITSTDDFPADPDVVSGTVFLFEPEGLAFDTPVTLAITYDEGALGALAEGELRLHKVAGSGWVEKASSVDTTSNTVSGEMNGFSKWGVRKRAASVSVPAVPSGLTVAVTVNFSELSVSWDAVPGATSYEVVYDNVETGDYLTVVYQGSATSFTATGLSNNTYWYKVRAINAAGSSAFTTAEGALPEYDSDGDGIPDSGEAAGCVQDPSC